MKTSNKIKYNLNKSYSPSIFKNRTLNHKTILRTKNNNFIMKNFNDLYELNKVKILIFKRKKQLKKITEFIDNYQNFNKIFLLSKIDSIKQYNKNLEINIKIEREILNINKLKNTKNHNKLLKNEIEYTLKNNYNDINNFKNLKSNFVNMMENMEFFKKKNIELIFLLKKNEKNIKELKKEIYEKEKKLKKLNNSKILYKTNLQIENIKEIFLLSKLKNVTYHINKERCSNILYKINIENNKNENSKLKFLNLINNKNFWIEKIKLFKKDSKSYEGRNNLEISILHKLVQKKSYISESDDMLYNIVNKIRKASISIKSYKNTKNIFKNNKNLIERIKNFNIKLVKRNVIDKFIERNILLSMNINNMLNIDEIIEDLDDYFEEETIILYELVIYFKNKKKSLIFANLKENFDFCRYLIEEDNLKIDDIIYKYNIKDVIFCILRNLFYKYKLDKNNFDTYLNNIENFYKYYKNDFIITNEINILNIEDEINIINNILKEKEIFYLKYILYKKYKKFLICKDELLKYN